MLIHRTSIVPISICVALLLGACASKVSNIAVEGSGGAVATGGSGGASSPVLCIFNQQSYVPGAAVPAPNTCNTCYCSAAGQVVCSNNICVSPGVGGAVSAGGMVSVGGAVVTGGALGIGGTKSASGTAAAGGMSSIVQLIQACPGLPYPNSVPDAGDCAGVAITLEPPPLDIYLMMDRTQSMTYTVQNTTLERWDVIQQGIQTFVNSAAVQAAAPRVGLAFFGATGNPNDPTECNSSSYATPLIEIEALATSGSKITQALANESALLGGQTPWFPALEGALTHSQQWQVANRQRTAIAVLITDGYPTECDTSVSDIQQMVGEFYAGVTGVYNTRGSPGIRTYIIGIAVDKFNLDAVAEAGGTGQSIIVDGVDAVNQFTSALSNIVQGAAPSCNLPLPNPPAGYTVDPAKVQLLYKPFVGAEQQMPLVESASNCVGPNGGFYYDNPTSPTQAILCPCSCANIGSGELEFHFACSDPLGLQ